VEEDWPDCSRVNRYVKSLPDFGTDAREILDAFADGRAILRRSGEDSEDLRG
jgi:hypothetical protein